MECSIGFSKSHIISFSGQYFVNTVCLCDRIYVVSNLPRLWLCGFQYSCYGRLCCLFFLIIHSRTLSTFFCFFVKFPFYVVWNLFQWQEELLISVGVPYIAMTLFTQYFYLLLIFSCVVYLKLFLLRFSVFTYSYLSSVLPAVFQVVYCHFLCIVEVFF